MRRGKRWKDAQGKDQTRMEVDARRPGDVPEGPGRPSSRPTPGESRRWSRTAWTARDWPTSRRPWRSPGQCGLQQSHGVADHRELPGVRGGHRQRHADERDRAVPRDRHDEMPRGHRQLHHDQLHPGIDHAGRRRGHNRIDPGVPLGSLCAWASNGNMAWQNFPAGSGARDGGIAVSWAWWFRRWRRRIRPTRPPAWPPWRRCESSSHYEPDSPASHSAQQTGLDPAHDDLRDRPQARHHPHQEPQEDLHDGRGPDARLARHRHRTVP